MPAIPWVFYLAAIPVLGIIVLVHEFGHFITAKWADIRVEEFGIGFPPRAFGIKRGETIYSINWLPIGGFVRMPGENGDATDESGVVDPRSFAAKSAGKRLIVLLAGVTMNIILAMVLFTAAHAVGQVEATYPALIGTVEQGSPAAAAGLRTGDKILSVDGQTVGDWTSFTTAVKVATNKAPAGATNEPVVLVVTHRGSSEPVTVTVDARVNPGPTQGRLGVQLDQNAKPLSVRRINEPLWQAPISGIKDVGGTVALIFTTVGQLIAGKIPLSQALSGPVGIVQQSGDIASAVPQLGWFPILYLTGALSVSLAVVNVLPIPALDGGRVLLILVELARRGKRLAPEREALINIAGMAVLLSLMLTLTYFDLTRIITGR
jgi:regulator of sigma E protease